jgi:hypothetical protein
VVQGDRAAFRPVRTGATNGERVVVHEGIQVGETVIRTPAGVRVGSRVRAVAGDAR